MINLLLSRQGLAASVAADLLSGDVLHVPYSSLTRRFDVRDLVGNAVTGSSRAKITARLLLYFHGILTFVGEQESDGEVVARLQLPNALARLFYVSEILLWWGLDANDVSALMVAPSAARLCRFVQGIYYTPKRGAWVSGAFTTEATFQGSVGGYIAGVINALGLGKVDVKGEAGVGRGRADLVIYNQANRRAILIELKLVRGSQLLFKDGDDGKLATYLAGDDSQIFPEEYVLQLRYTMKERARSKSNAGVTSSDKKAAVDSAVDAENREEAPRTATLRMKGQKASTQCRKYARRLLQELKNTASDDNQWTVIPFCGSGSPSSRLHVGRALMLVAAVATRKRRCWRPCGGACRWREPLAGGAVVDAAFASVARAAATAWMSKMTLCSRDPMQRYAFQTVYKCVQRSCSCWEASPLHGCPRCIPAPAHGSSRGCTTGGTSAASRRCCWAGHFTSSFCLPTWPPGVRGL